MDGLTWIEPNALGACAYPRGEVALGTLAGEGVTLLINLHERAHEPDLLARNGITQIHLPVRDFTPPTPAQLDEGVTTILSAIAAGQRVVVHCAGGLGRTGTLVACYLVSTGMTPDDAIARVRAARPGSVETREQEEAVRAFQRRTRPAAP